jgi:hypothetical protein
MIAFSGVMVKISRQIPVSLTECSPRGKPFQILEPPDAPQYSNSLDISPRYFRSPGPPRLALGGITTLQFLAPEFNIHDGTTSRVCQDFIYLPGK